jgi:predicted nucleotidyltransferase
MRTAGPALLPIFRSDLQARLLTILMLEDGDPLPTPELGRRTGASAASLHRELRRLEDAGLIERDAVGRTKRYRAAQGSPLHEPLRELVTRSLGVEATLRSRLQSLPGVEAAAIFGSWAAGRVGPDSDIDLLVVGNVDRDGLLALAREVELLAGREVNVTAYRPAEFRRRRRGRVGFLATVLDRPLIPLVGDLPRE